MVKLSDLKVGSQVRALSTGDGTDAISLFGDIGYKGTLVKGDVYTVCKVEAVQRVHDKQPVAIAVPNDPIFHDGFWVTLDNIELVQEEQI